MLLVLCIVMCMPVRCGLLMECGNVAFCFHLLSSYNQGGYQVRSTALLSAPFVN